MHNGILSDGLAVMVAIDWERRRSSFFFLTNPAKGRSTEKHLVERSPAATVPGTWVRLLLPRQ